MIANYHTHTTRCHHARDPEDQYVQAALQKGLKTLGFSDHSPYLFPGDYYSGFRMRPEELEGYCDTVRALRKHYAGRIDLPLGLETEYYPAYFPNLLPFLQDAGVEYLLLGQHFVDNEIGAHYSGLPTGEEAILARYCWQTMEAMNTGLFSYFAHPDLLFFTGEDKIYRAHMRLLCREAKSCGIPLEVNLLGIREARNYPDVRFWELAAEENCDVILGIDAHAAAHILEAEAEPEARKILGYFGLTPLEEIPLRHI